MLWKRLTSLIGHDLLTVTGRIFLVQRVDPQRGIVIVPRSTGNADSKRSGPPGTRGLRDGR
jgi:hypothetical protein